MNRPPPRLLDDPSASPSLREDISNVNVVPPKPFNLEAGLKRFQSSLQNQPVRQDSNPKSSPSSVNQPNIAHIGSGLKSIGTKFWIITAVGAVSTAVFLGVYQYRDSDQSANDGKRMNTVVEMSKPSPFNPTREFHKPAQRESANGNSKEAKEHFRDKTLAEHSQTSTAVASPANKKANSKKDTPVNKIKTTISSETIRLPVDAISQNPQTASVRTQEEFDPDSRLRKEIAQLAETRKLLSTHPLEALNLAKQGQVEFRDGMFAEEREAIIVFALDELQQKTETVKHAARFLARYPQGPFSERIKKLVQDEQENDDPEEPIQQ